MGNPSVRFDEGRESHGHWPRAFQSILSRLLYEREGADFLTTEAQRHEGFNKDPQVGLLTADGGRSGRKLRTRKASAPSYPPQPLQALQALQGLILQWILKVEGFTQGVTGVTKASRLNELTGQSAVIRLQKTLAALKESSNP